MASNLQHRVRVLITTRSFAETLPTLPNNVMAKVSDMVWLWACRRVLPCIFPFVSAKIATIDFKCRTYTTTTFLAEVLNVQGRCLKREMFECQGAVSMRATKWQHVALEPQHIITHCSGGLGHFMSALGPTLTSSARQPKHTRQTQRYGPRYGPRYGQRYGPCYGPRYGHVMSGFATRTVGAPLTTPITFGQNFLRKWHRLLCAQLKQLPTPEKPLQWSVKYRKSPSMWTVLIGAEFTKDCTTSKMPNRNNFNIVTLATSHLHSNKSRSEFNIHSANKIWWQNLHWVHWRAHLTQSYNQAPILRNSCLSTPKWTNDQNGLTGSPITRLQTKERWSPDSSASIPDVIP